MFDTCGPASYSITNQQFYQSYQEVTDSHVQVNTDPGLFSNFATAAPTFTAQTNNAFLADMKPPYTQSYQLYLTASLPNYSSLVTYAYFDVGDPSMTSRMQELELEVYDGCIAPIWEVKSFVPSNTIEVYQTGSEVYYPKVDHTNCFTDPTSLCYCYSDLSLPCHRTYQAPGKGSDCGQEQFNFSLPDWVVSKT